MGGARSRGPLLLLLLGPSLAADPTQPHSHQGVLTAFPRGGYRKAGIVLDSRVEERLRSSPVVTVKNTADGVIRSTSIQDVSAPPEVVWKLLLDFNAYPKFIEGIKSCKPYKSQWNLAGAHIVCADYRLRVGTFTLQYFLEHTHEPLKQCMTWTLDYSRASDVHDSVGYWHVVPHNGGARVFYATDSVLPAWIPGPIKATFARIAMSKATARLPDACRDAMQAKEQARPTRLGSLSDRFASLRKPELPSMDQLPSWISRRLPL